MRYVLVLETVPHLSPATVRLRRALKCLLRWYGFRAVKVTKATEGRCYCCEAR